ncbi:YggS family pyridoxal phosphate enzyme [Betaproteobacteria bacterium SCGC AG-212-J23]|nr:YggS family pyridoxal phosphate enzyme [Betaproteobacteria bacterium SCGC AG-212-J23]
MATIGENLQQVKARLAGVRGVILLAVSKGQPVESIRAAAVAGQKAFGENYVQEAIEKMNLLRGNGNELSWHLIGPLQSNKTRVVAERFDWVQTVASEKIARRLSEQRPASLAPLNVLIQVNVSGEPTKSGVAPGGVNSLSKSIKNLKGIRLRGLMAIPEPGADRARYRSVKALYDSLKADYEFDTLSLGMSDDMDVAIAEGSTMVRIGTAIFGARKTHKSAA